MEIFRGNNYKKDSLEDSSDLSRFAAFLLAVFPNHVIHFSQSQSQINCAQAGIRLDNIWTRQIQTWTKYFTCLPGSGTSSEPNCGPSGLDCCQHCYHDSSTNAKHEKLSSGNNSNTFDDDGNGGVDKDKDLHQVRSNSDNGNFSRNRLKILQAH